MTPAYENLSNRAQSAALQCWLSWGAVHAPEKLPAGALSKLLLVALCPGFWGITAVLWCHASVIYLLLPFGVSWKTRTLICALYVLHSSLVAAGTLDPCHLQNVQLWLRDVLVLDTVLLLGYVGWGKDWVWYSCFRTSCCLPLTPNWLKQPDMHGFLENQEITSGKIACAQKHVTQINEMGNVALSKQDL